MRSQPSQERSRQTVRAVLSAANAEFAEHGFFAAQMTRIAERAGVSPGSMYRFFPDKEQLAAALSDAYIEAVAEHLVPVVSNFAGIADLDKTIEELLRVVASLQSEHGGYYRLTGDVSPLAENWVANGVVDAMVDSFSSRLREFGCSAVPGADLRVVLTTVIETGRSWLARLPFDGAERAERLDELQIMLTSYLHKRLEGPGGGPLSV